VWHHSQSQKYISYRNAAREGQHHGDRQHAQKIWWSLAMLFKSYASRQADKQTEQHIEQQTDRCTHHNTSHPSWGEVTYIHLSSSSSSLAATVASFIPPDLPDRWAICSDISSLGGKLYQNLLERSLPNYKDCYISGWEWSIWHSLCNGSWDIAIVTN